MNGEMDAGDNPVSFTHRSRRLRCLCSFPGIVAVTPLALSRPRILRFRSVFWVQTKDISQGFEVGARSFRRSSSTKVLLRPCRQDGEHAANSAGLVSPAWEATDTGTIAKALTLSVLLKTKPFFQVRAMT